jgi:DNA-binding transcriptional LysR family regulator
MSRARVSRWLMKHAGDIRPVYRSNSLFNQMQAISNGFGVGVLPCHLADRHLADRQGGLERVFMPRPALTVPLWLLTHADLAKTARIRAFLDFIAAAARADRALLAGRANPTAEAELSVP